MSKYRKAIAAVVGAVVAVAAVFGLNIDPQVSATVISVLTSIAVYVVPNSKK